MITLQAGEKLPGCRSDKSLINDIWMIHVWPNLRPLKQRLKLTLSTAELTRAFRHRSYVYEQIVPPESNERLEFLGDAVVDLVVRE